VKRKNDPEQANYLHRSNQNMRNQDRMTAEMEAGGFKVKRHEQFESMRAKLVVPEKTVLYSMDDHDYYPNAVRDLYDTWVKAGKSVAE
jgi:hypothetical protein